MFIAYVITEPMDTIRILGIAIKYIGFIILMRGCRICFMERWISLLYFTFKKSPTAAAMNCPITVA